MNIFSELKKREKKKTHLHPLSLGSSLQIQKGHSHDGNGPSKLKCSKYQITNGVFVGGREATRLESLIEFVWKFFPLDCRTEQETRKPKRRDSVEMKRESEGGNYPKNFANHSRQ
jgi:hypothetical protein